jgi:hypothetical protein
LSVGTHQVDSSTTVHMQMSGRKLRCEEEGLGLVMIAEFGVQKLSAAMHLRVAGLGWAFSRYVQPVSRCLPSQKDGRRAAPSLEEQGGP